MRDQTEVMDALCGFDDSPATQACEVGGCETSEGLSWHGD